MKHNYFIMENVLLMNLYGQNINSRKVSNLQKGTATDGEAPVL